MRDTAVFGGEYILVSSNHLGLRSVWKSLVASCVCVCGLSSNACFQRVRLQRETGSSPVR